MTAKVRRLTQNDLDAILATIPNIPKLVKENTQTTLNSSTNTSSFDDKRVETKMLGFFSEVATTGQQGWTKYRFVYQISIFLPSGYGIDEANYFADEIIEYYPLKTITADSGLCIKIDRHDIGSSFDRTNYLMVPITIEGSVFKQRI